MVLQCSPSIMEYYRYWIQRELGVRTCQPMAKCHVSMIRGEEPRDKAYWDTLPGKQLSLTYSPDVRTNGKHWWVFVNAPEILEIRRKLGLSKPKYPLHMTIGTTVEKK